jgi:predicted MFS family arabinose efflux permease
MRVGTNLSLIIASSLLGGMYFCVLLPLGGLLMAERGVPVWQIGIIGGVPWGALLFSTLGVPFLLRSIKPRRLFLLARWFAMTAAVIFVLTDNLWLWTIAYALVGLSGGIAWVIGDTLLATLPPPEQRAKVMSLYMFLVNFNIILGPLLVAVMGTGQISFFIGAFIILVNLLISYVVQFPEHDSTTPAAAGLALLQQVGLPIAGLLMVALASGSLEGSAGKMLPVQAFALGYSERVAALAAVASGAGNLVSQLALWALLRRYTAHQLVKPGLLLMALAVLLIIPSAGQMVSYFAVLFLAGGIAGALYTLVVLDVTKGVDTVKGMQRISCIAALYTSGGVLGPLLAGSLMSINMLWGYSLAMVAVTLTALVVYIYLPVKGKP